MQIIYAETLAKTKNAHERDKGNIYKKNMRMKGFLVVVTHSTDILQESHLSLCTSLVRFAIVRLAAN